MLSIAADKKESPKGLLANLLDPKSNGKDDKFSLLLKSFSFGKIDTKELAKADGKSEMPKTSSASALLKLFTLGKEDAADEELINTDLIKAFPGKTIQQLIGEAKAFLKDQISQKTGIKELPNTLGGLIKLAEKSGIDIKAIHYESFSQDGPDTALPKSSDMSKISIQNTFLPHSTSELVKPSLSPKKESPAELQPLSALLNKEKPADGDDTPVKGLILSAGLSALLHAEKTEEAGEAEAGMAVESEKSSDKIQVLQHSKTEPLTQKIVESKQLIEHMAQNIKESVENYKPPFTRIKVQLNPHKFGEMEVTLVQRGNNVHININANSNALTVMMQNAHELKTQLSAQGLGDASMNFTSQQQQQSNQQKREDAHSAYQNLQEFEEEFTEIATALEIVVPRYI